MICKRIFCAKFTHIHFDCHYIVFKLEKERICINDLLKKWNVLQKCYTFPGVVWLFARNYVNGYIEKSKENIHEQNPSQFPIQRITKKY